MTFTDYFLKFNSKTQALSVFSSIEGHTNNFPDKDPEIILQTETFVIDEVGILYNDDSVYNINSDTGEIISFIPATEIEGYHYNYRIVYGNKEEPPIPFQLEPYLVTPTTPHRTFL